MEVRPPKWRVAANILNKQSRTADKGWSSSLGVGQGVLITPRRKKTGFVTKHEHLPWAWTDHLVRPKQRERDKSVFGAEERRIQGSGGET